MKRGALSTWAVPVFCKIQSEICYIVRACLKSERSMKLEIINAYWSRISTDPIAAALAGFLVASLFLYGVRAIVRRYGPKK